MVVFTICKPMNTDKLILTFTALLCLNSISVDAQTTQHFQGEIAFLSSPNPTPKGQSNRTGSSIYRVAKKLSFVYSGYAIEIACSTLPLDKYHPIFSQFGNVYYHKLKEGGYSYLILAEFSSDRSALEFLQNIIQPRVKTAKLYIYKDGNRKVLSE